MSMLDWAKQECIIACKKENPKFDFNNEKDWDYGCNCYKSALNLEMVQFVQGISELLFLVTGRAVMSLIIEDKRN